MRRRFAPDGVSDPEDFWEKAVQWRDAVMAYEAELEHLQALSVVVVEAVESVVEPVPVAVVVPEVEEVAVPVGFWRRVWKVVSGY